jgi:hypothetical protein
METATSKAEVAVSAATSSSGVYTAILQSTNHKAGT